MGKALQGRLWEGTRDKRRIRTKPGRNAAAREGPNRERTQLPASAGGCRNWEGRAADARRRPGRGERARREGMLPHMMRARGPVRGIGPPEK